MAKTLPLPPPGFEELSVEEQIDYIQSLWERIAAHPEDIPVPDWHRKIIEERLADLDENPDAGIPWEEVRETMKKHLDGANE
jgi:putative addiction module component (TIGR02574 family)